MCQNHWSSWMFHRNLHKVTCICNWSSKIFLWHTFCQCFAIFEQMQLCFAFFMVTSKSMCSFHKISECVLALSLATAWLRFECLCFWWLCCLGFSACNAGKMGLWLGWMRKHNGPNVSNDNWTLQIMVKLCGVWFYSDNDQKLQKWCSRIVTNVGSMTLRKNMNCLSWMVSFDNFEANHFLHWLLALLLCTFWLQSESFWKILVFFPFVQLQTLISTFLALNSTLSNAFECNWKATKHFPQLSLVCNQDKMHHNVIEDSQNVFEVGLCFGQPWKLLSFCFCSELALFWGSTSWNTFCTSSKLFVGSINQKCNFGLVCADIWTQTEKEPSWHQKLKRRKTMIRHRHCPEWCPFGWSIVICCTNFVLSEI